MLILPALLSMAFLSLAAGHAHDAGGTGVPVPGAGTTPHAYALAVQPVPAFSGTQQPAPSQPPPAPQAAAAAGGSADSGGGRHAPATAGAAAVAGTVFLDADGDGTRDAGEAGIAGHAMLAVDLSTGRAADATTDPDGAYAFGSVAPSPGVTLVQVRGFPPGHAITTGDFYAYVEPAAGQVARFDVGFRPLLPSELVTLDVTAYRDANANGERDAGEGGMEGVTVTVYTYATGGVREATTGAGGTASVAGLMPAAWLAQAAVPEGHTATAPVGGNSAGVAGALVVGSPEPGSAHRMEVGLAPDCLPPDVPAGGSASPAAVGTIPDGKLTVRDLEIRNWYGISAATCHLAVPDREPLEMLTHFGRTLIPAEIRVDPDLAEYWHPYADPDGAYAMVREIVDATGGTITRFQINGGEWYEFACSGCDDPATGNATGADLPPSCGVTIDCLPPTDPREAYASLRADGTQVWWTGFVTDMGWLVIYHTHSYNPQSALRYQIWDSSIPSAEAEYVRFMSDFMDGMGFEGWDIVRTSRGTNDTNNWYFIINGFRHESMGVGEIVNRTGLTAAQAALYTHADYASPYIYNSLGYIEFHFVGRGVLEMYFLGWSNEAVPNPIIGRQEAVERAVAFALSDETLTGPNCLLSLSEPYGHKRYVSPVTVAGTPFWGVDIGTCDAVDAGRSADGYPQSKSAYVTVLVDALDGGDVFFTEGSVCYPNRKVCD